MSDLPFFYLNYKFLSTRYILIGLLGQEMYWTSANLCANRKLNSYSVHCLKVCKRL